MAHDRSLTGFRVNTLWDWLHLLLLPLLIPTVVAPALTSIATAGLLESETGQRSEPEPVADDPVPERPVQPDRGKQAGSYP